MKQMILALGLVAVVTPALGASTNGMQFAGQSSDPRVTGCGVTIETGPFAAIVPFIETATPLAGTYRLDVTKISQSGTSRSIQANVFSGSDLGDATVMVDWPAELTVRLTIMDESGASLCDALAKVGLPQV